MVLNQKSKIIKDSEHDFHVKSNRLSLTEKLNTTYFYQNFKIKFGNDQVHSYVVSNDGFEKYELNNVGLQLIKNYNWIIDYKNHKVYYENYIEYKLNVIKASKNHLNKCAVKDGELIVIQKLDQTGSLIYELGDQILSVNEIPITSKNICSYSKLLNDYRLEYFKYKHKIQALKFNKFEKLNLMIN